MRCAGVNLHGMPEPRTPEPACHAAFRERPACLVPLAGA